MDVEALTLLQLGYSLVAMNLISFPFLLVFFYLIRLPPPPSRKFFGSVSLSFVVVVIQVAFNNSIPLYLTLLDSNTVPFAHSSFCSQSVLLLAISTFSSIQPAL